MLGVTEAWSRRNTTLTGEGISAKRPKGAARKAAMFHRGLQGVGANHGWR